METPSVICYFAPGNRKGRKVAESFAMGAGGGYTDSPGLLPGEAAFYGVKPAMAHVWHDARASGRTWYYIDNGYFGRGSYFSVTVNAERHDGVTGVPDFDRLEQLGVEIRPWQENRRGHILVTLQSRDYYDIRGIDRDEWLAGVCAELKRHTGREIRVRDKPARLAHQDTPFAEDMTGAWAVVTYTSNTALEAVMAGIPAFVLGRCHINPLAESCLSRIERPLRPSDGARLEVAGLLAANQWTKAEMRNGTCWAVLQERRARDRAA